MANLAAIFESSLPYLGLTLYQLSLAIHVSLQKAVIFDGVSPIVFAAYQQVVAAFVLCGLAIIFERGNRPPLSFNFLSWAFLIGFLQIPGGEVLMTVSLRYVSVVIETVGSNMIPTVIFVLTIFTGQEAFKLWSLIGQVKLLSIVSSAVGATMLIFFSNPGALDEESLDKDGWWFGCFLVGTFILMFSMAAIFLGIFVVGLGYLFVNWCIRIRGPVFANAFSPLLVVFSFLLQILLFGHDASIWSIASALLVICSLYLLLWAKSKEIVKIDGENSSETSNVETLLLNSTA